MIILERTLNTELIRFPSIIRTKRLRPLIKMELLMAVVVPRGKELKSVLASKQVNLLVILMVIRAMVHLRIRNRQIIIKA